MNTDALLVLELDVLDFLWQFVTGRCLFHMRPVHVKLCSGRVSTFGIWNSDSESNAENNVVRKTSILCAIISSIN